MTNKVDKLTCCCCLPIKCALQVAVVVGFISALVLLSTSIYGYQDTKHIKFHLWFKILGTVCDFIFVWASIQACMWFCQDTRARRGLLVRSFAMNLLTCVIIGVATTYTVLTTPLIDTLSKEIEKEKKDIDPNVQKKIPLVI